MRDARERCPGFVVRPQRVERYVEVHERMVGAVGQVLPVAAVHSIDEVSARLSPRDDPESVVDRVKRSVAGALSPLVPVSVGVAPSAWLAKCAAEAHKPLAAVVWRRDDLPPVYAGLEFEDLPGAGPRICERLRAAGLTTVEAIYAASRSRIIVAWGSIEGERVRLAVCALHRCADGGQAPGRVRLEVGTVGGVVRSGVGRLDAFGYEFDLLRAVSMLWDEAAASAADDPPGRVGVLLEALCDPTAPTLFEVDPRERRLQWTIDRVRARYGARALLWGVCGDPRGPYTGAKIAYHSFPDMARLRWLGRRCGGRR